MLPRVAARHDRSAVARYLAWALALLTAAVLAMPARAADSGVDALAVKLRGDAMTTDLQARLQDALGLPFTVSGRTRDGAYTLQLAQPTDLATVRAALNRARLDAAVLYANVAPGAPVPATSGPPTDRIIVKYTDPGLVANAQAGLPLDPALVAQLASTSGQALAWQRGLPDGGNVLQMLQRLPVVQVEALAATIGGQAGIDYAQPDYIRTTQLVPTDPCYASASVAACNGNYQWDLFDPVGGINMPAAWDITTGSASVNAAVIDTGALFNHPDLSGRYVGGYDMIADPVVANDGGGRDPDASDPGDWVAQNECGSNNASNSSWHGTHVAGTIGAAPNNGIGVAGINWVSKVVPVRVLGKCGGYTSDIAAAIIWAAGGSVAGVPANPNPVRVMNLSLGGGGSCDSTSQNAVNTALSLGAAVVVAAGNNNGNAANFSPASCSGVITVAATNKTGRKSWYSNYGAVVEIAAPGGAGGDGNDPGILSTLNSGATVPASYIYANYSGTSMATPHVTGVASLMFSVNPALTPAQVLSKIQTTARAFPTPGPSCGATPPNSSCNCTTALCGSGIIDAGAAVAAAVGSGTTVASSLNPATPGAAVTFTATVTGVNPTGSVDFRDAGVTFGGCGAVALAGAGNIRTAQCTTSALALGVHSITATYSGDGGNPTSTSPPLSQTIAKVASATGLGMSPNPAAPGALVTMTATVTGSAPTGTVNFKDGVLSVAGCSAVALVGAGNVRTAQCQTTSLAFGTHPISAVYSGDAANNGSTSATVYELIFGSGPSTTTTALGSSLNPAPAGQLVTYTATVNGASPTGTVNFKDGGVTFGGCGAVALTGSGNSRIAQCQTSSLAAGAHSLTATYSGDAGNLSSTSPTLTQTINAGPVSTTTALGSSLNPAPAGQSVTYTATVTGSAPTGTVNFMDSGVTFGGCGAVALTGVGNVRTAQCTTSSLAVGTHSLTAAYSGDAGNLASSSSPALPQVINPPPAPTTTALASSLNPAPAGQLVTYTATVTGTSPTGTVNFMDGGVTFGGCGAVALTGPVGNVRTAQCTTSSLAVGTHNLTAAYSGDGGNQASTSSPALSQVITAVGPPPATVGLASSVNPSPAGSLVVLTATVTGNAPTGNVTFKDGAATIPGCAAVNLAFGFGNSRTAYCYAYSLTLGTHSIVATYNGDTNNGAASSPTLSQVVH